MTTSINVKQLIQRLAGTCLRQSTQPILLFWLLFGAMPLVAQDIRFENYTSVDGLPSNELSAVTESSDGYLWIGSTAGLTRFDGLNFDSLLHERDDDLALPGRAVQYLLDDSKGRLWVGTEAGGLLQVDSFMNIVRHLSTTTNPIKLPNDSIWSIAEDCDGNILLGFPGDGVGRLNVEQNTLELMPMDIPGAEDESRLVTSLHVDRNCRVWAGLYYKGLMVMDQTKSRFVPVNSEDWPIQDKSAVAIASHNDHIYVSVLNDIGIFDSITGDYLNKIDIGAEAGVDRVGFKAFSIHDDTLWAASSSGLYSIHLNVEPKPIDTAELDQMLAQGSFSSEYYIRRYSRKEAVSESLVSNTQLFVAAGRNGNIWVATRDYGLVYKPPGWDNFNLLRRDRLADEYLPSNNIITTFVNGEHLWLGTYDAGVARYDYSSGRLDTPEQLKELPFGRVWAIHADNENTIWVAGISQFIRYTPGQPPEEMPLPEEIATTLDGIRPLGFVAFPDAYWVVSKHHYLLRHDRQTRQWQLHQTQDPEQTNTFTDYLRINDHQFLLSTETRLYRYDSRSDDFEILLDAAEDNIQQIALDSSRAVWLAQKSGITKYRADAQGLHSELKLRYSAMLRTTAINNMLFDGQGQLWLGTLNGLFKLLPAIDSVEDNSEPSFLHLTRSDGLPSNEVNANTLRMLNNGQLAFATNQGGALFDPRKIRPQTARPQTNINALGTLEHTYNGEMLNQALVFEHNDNTISVRFNAVTFNNRDDLDYQYKLEGWDQDWITTRQVPQVTYSRLDHGTYNFHVRARLGSAEWGALNNRLSFTIKRPPWMTWWAYVLYSAMAFLLLWSLYQRRVRASSRRRALYQAHERQKFAETQTRIATDFASAIHYEEIADTLSTTLKASMPMVRMLVHFPDETDFTHEYIYDRQWAERIPADVDFPGLYIEFDNNPKMRHHQQEIVLKDNQNAHQLSLPLGAKRPVQALVCLHFPPDTPPAENDIALASLVAQTAESAIHNTLLLEQVSQLAELNQRANDAKSEFISTVSHEIRTPLHGLMGMLDLLNNCDSDEQRIVVLNRLTDSSQQLLSVVDDVLDISKIEANKVELSQDTFDLHDVIDYVTQLFQDQAFNKSLYLYGVIAPNVCGWWLGDKTRLIQILTNLTNNAIKFTSSGGLCITAHEIRDPNAPGLQLTVTDTGLGMSPEVIDKLFDEYQQAEDWTWKKYGGSGLGLSITKRLVELIGGRIEATSKVGQGSQFHVFLPLQKPDILTEVEALQWPDNLVIHLACGNDNDTLEPLFNNGNQVVKHAYQPSDELANLDGQCDVLVTDSLLLAQQCHLQCALLSDGTENQPMTINENIKVFSLNNDWDALLVWLMSAANRCRQ